MQSFLSMSVFIFDEFLIFDLENHIAVKVDQKVPQTKNVSKRSKARSAKEANRIFFHVATFLCFFKL